MKCNSQHDVNIYRAQLIIFQWINIFYSDERGQTKVGTEHETKLCLWNAGTCIVTSVRTIGLLYLI